MVRHPERGGPARRTRTRRSRSAEDPRLRAAGRLPSLAGVTDTGGDETDALPRVSALHQNVPNPFNPTTTIRFDLAREGHVELRIYDVAGHVVKTLVNGTLAPGRNIAIPWSGLDEAGARVPSGVYFYQLVTDDFTATKKMVLMK